MKVTIELTSNGWMVFSEHPLLGKKGLGPSVPRPQSFVEACELARRLIHHAADTTIAEIHKIQDTVDRPPASEIEPNVNLIRGPWTPARPLQVKEEEPPEGGDGYEALQD